MKDQYVADIGDYGKFALLKAFSDEGVCVGVNWYYTSNDGTTAGGKTDYLEKPERFKDYCPDVFQKMDVIYNTSRTIEAIEASGILSDACYYKTKVEFSGSPNEIMSKRLEWKERSLEILSKADLVYLDPDNGLLTNEKIKRRKAASKYALPDEVEAYYRDGKNVVYYCHRGRRKKPVWEEYKSAMLRRLPSAKPVVLTFHKGIQRSYIFLIHASDYENYRKILDSFLVMWEGAFTEESIKDPLLKTTDDCDKEQKENENER